LFSIIVPLYNKKQYVARALNSVAVQYFKEYEIIVVDDGSTDGSWELVEAQFGNEVQLIRQSNQGVSQARNRGIQDAKFPYIAFLDADDYWHPQYLQFVSMVIRENHGVGIIGCHYDPFKLETNPTLSYFRLHDYFRMAVQNTRFFTSATCVKREFFDHQPGFDKNLKLGEDIDVWLRASLFFGNGFYIQNTLVYYGQEDSNSATKKLYCLDETLIPKLLHEDYFSNSKKYSKCLPDTFEAFKSKWVYLNLFPHFENASNQPQIKSVIAQIPQKYFLVHIVYSLPFNLLKVIFQKDYFSNLFRNYLKFCFRYLYK